MEGTSKVNLETVLDTVLRTTRDTAYVCIHKYRQMLRRKRTKAT